MAPFVGYADSVSPLNVGLLFVPPLTYRTSGLFLNGSVGKFVNSSFINLSGSFHAVTDLPTGIYFTGTAIAQCEIQALAGYADSIVRFYINNFLIETKPAGSSDTILSGNVTTISNILAAFSWSWRVEFDSVGGSGFAAVILPDSPPVIGNNELVVSGSYSTWSTQLSLNPPIVNTSDIATLTDGGNHLDDVDTIYVAYFDPDTNEPIEVEGMIISQTPGSLSFVVPASLPSSISDYMVTVHLSNGRVVLAGYFEVLVADGSGIYQLVIGKTNDTIYDRTTPGDTTDVKIPNPFIKTGFVP